MKKLILISLSLLISTYSTSFWGGTTPNLDGSWFISPSETLKANKEMGIDIPRKYYVRILKSSKEQRYEFENDFVSIYEKGKIGDGCLLNESKTTMECKRLTFKIFKNAKYIYLKADEIKYRLALEKR